MKVLAAPGCSSLLPADGGGPGPERAGEFVRPRDVPGSG